MNLLGTFSRFILDLYQAVERVDATEFRGWALHRLQQHIEFDSAIWIQGILLEGVPITHNVYVHHLPREMLQDYATWAADDDLFETVLCNPGRCILASDLQDWAVRRETAMYREYLAKYRIEEAAGIMIPFGASGIQSFVTLFRGRRDQPFTASERDWFQAASPHLVEAETIGSIRHLRRLHRNAALEGAIAVVSTEGHMKIAEQEFIRHLDCGWPDWSPPQVPHQVLAVAERKRTGGQVVDRHYVHAAATEDDFIIAIRPVSPLDRLTLREREIAVRITDGLSYKQVASELGISPSTVTNHVNAIYEKLGVSSSATLRKAVENA